jgi:hypothetical protein
VLCCFTGQVVRDILKDLQGQTVEEAKGTSILLNVRKCWPSYIAWHLRDLKLYRLSCFLPFLYNLWDLLFKAGVAQLVQSGDWILVGAKFSAPVQIIPGAHAASCTVGTRSFLGLKGPRHDINLPSPTGTKVKGRVKLYFYSSSGLAWPEIGWNVPCTFMGLLWPVNSAFV